MRSRFLVLDGEPIRLSERPVSVGRSAAADVVVSGAQVAPFQIVVDTSVEPAEVRDQTGQGVLVNGHRVARWTLANGDELSFASTRLTYESEAVNGG
jgi:pSer/pThr/pTyr-binding forkhead associated (FHA) protein